MEDPRREEDIGSAGGRPRQRSSIPSFLFISLMLFLLTSHNSDEFLARHQYQDALRSLEYRLSNYTAWMNGTSSNFTVPDQDPNLPPLLESFDVREKPVDPSWSSYYSNITGFVHGTTQFHNISPSVPMDNTSAPWNAIAQAYMTGVNATKLAEFIGTWNWTASEKVALSVVERLPLYQNGSVVSKNIALVHGRIELTDSTTSEDLRLEFEGIHFRSSGSIYGFAEPTGRHIDIRFLPSLVPVSAKNETAHVVEPELIARIGKLKKLIDVGIIDQDSNEEAPKSTCPFVFFAQLHPVDLPEDVMQELEEETQRPTGIWTVSPPKMSLSGLLISKECGIMYQVTKTEGLRSRTFFRKVTTYAGLAALAYLLLLFLCSRQTERSRTPSGLARVSRWSFLAQATVDSVAFAGHITFAILAEGRPSLSLIAPAFLACILFVYEAQFSVLIHQIQLPENLTSLPPVITPPAAPPAPAPTSTSPTTAVPTSGINSYPPPVPTTTNQVPASPQPTGSLPTTNVQIPAPTSFFSFFIHHIRTDPQARLWVTLFVFLTCVVRVILSPTLSMVFVAISYSFIWLPQIIRSVQRGRSSGLAKEYILGTTVCRLYLALYFLACPKNVLDVEPRSWSYLLAIFVSFQALIVILQEVFGPTFFLTKKYATVKTYNYHPPLPSPDSEAPEQSLGDCAICMDAIRLDPSGRYQSEKGMSGELDRDPSVPNGSRRKSLGNPGGLFTAMNMGIDSPGTRKVYSLAPCHHLFHTECLEKWLAIKNICPQCRRPLPPL